MNNAFWIGVYPSLSNDILDFIIAPIDALLGVSF